MHGHYPYTRDKERIIVKILVADDHQLVVDDLIYYLKKLRPDAETVGTSEPDRIAELFDEMKPDVVFIDIELDGRNGIAVAKKLQEKRPRTNIIYITGYEKYALESYKTYASAFLVKPIDEDMLRDALEHLRFPISSITDEMLRKQYLGDSVIGARIQKCREECGLTRAELAEKIGCVMPTIQRWETGVRVPDIPMIMKLANVLGVEISELIG